MSAQLLTMRILAVALMMSLLFFALALWFVVGAVSLALITAVGYRAPALEPGTRPEDGVRTGLGVLRTGQVLRFALSEAPALVGMALAFVVDQGGYLVFLVGAGVSLALAALHVWPRDAQVTRVQQRLESAGARAPLLETLHDQPTH